MADVINEVMKTNHLLCLSNTLRYINLHDKLTVLDNSIPFTDPSALLYQIPTLNDKYTDLYVNDFISVCLDWEVDSLHKTTQAFNIITNVFDMGFKYAIEDNSNNIIRNYTLSLRKLRGEGTPSEIKKVLNWIINTRLLNISLPPEKREK